MACCRRRRVHEPGARLPLRLGGVRAPPRARGPVGSKWFPDKRGLVVGIMVGGYGAGSAIFGPVATELIERIGWRVTFQILGALFFAMGLVGTWLLRNPPPGYRPPRWSPQQTTGGPARAAPDISTGKMVRGPTFYAPWSAPPPG